VTQQPSFTTDATVSPVLAQLTDGLRSILGGQLVGIYLYGSLITGDFAPGVSDVDLVVIMTAALDSVKFKALRKLHQSVVERYPEWHDRLELAYISGAALRSFRHQTSTIGIISPGEPFHLLEAGSDWLISWHALREDGQALLGPPIESLIDEISTDEYLSAVSEHISRYRDSVKKPHNKSALSYIILTVSRGLYTLSHGEPASKIKAAAWAKGRLPHWAALIDRALTWRLDPTADKLTAEQIRPQAEAFVLDALARLPQ